MKVCKIFVVGPEENGTEKPGYLHVKEAIYKIFNEFVDKGKSKFDALEVYDPRNNPGGDNFNNWIFAQIDTCNLLVADITSFNPNVVYEVALAHSLGVPCQYVRFGKQEDGEFYLEGEEANPDSIAHYFNNALLSPASTVDQAILGKGQFAERLELFFKEGRSPAQNLMTTFYGGVPLVDAEFTRGLAQTYCRNFLLPMLRVEITEEMPARRLKIVMPDTFARPDSVAREKLIQALDGGGYGELGKNMLGRKFNVIYEPSTGTVYDLPSIAFTIADCRRFKGVNNREIYSELDKDRHTDVMCRKFVSEVRIQLEENNNNLETLAGDVSFVWLSQIVGDWAKDGRLINHDPLEQPN
ncbi:hypothetical protein A8B82_10695 [Sulfitobacter sp. EhC04]|uniref:hypothetical protein n=1 Tax=Sulfitobacter sp. EhC04 TaxID=1849168 RepID=UPI0007F3694E|nr:hypothetical protein [Sulfitobacter sp. EhC04]OAN78203.1 hypothetical protein A8B82_10695 [Sulfitobacter sp. EhC04]